MASERLGKVQTVCGLVAPDSLGMTLPHEHLSMESFPGFVMPPEPGNADMPFTLDNVGWIQRYPYSHHENLVLKNAKEAIIEEMKLLKAAGCGTIVDITATGTQRSVHFQVQVAQEAGLNVIAGTGFYVHPYQTAATLRLTQEQMVAAILKDITEGADGTAIRCGVIGEVGCSHPLTDFEKRSIRASAVCQEELGAPVVFHSAAHPDSPFDILRIFLEAGGSVTNAVMGHLDRSIFDEGRLLEFAALGTYCQYDLFGLEIANNQLRPSVDMPNDGQRIDKIMALIRDGKEDGILISTDVHTKHRLLKFGGHGFCHILHNVVPHMERKGVDKEVLHKILVDNPKAWLTFRK